MQLFSLLLPYVSLSCSRRVPVVLHVVEVTLHFFVYPCHFLPFLKCVSYFFLPILAVQDALVVILLYQ